VSSITENRKEIESHLDNVRSALKLHSNADVLKIANGLIDGVCTPLLDKVVELEAINYELRDALWNLRATYSDLIPADVLSDIGKLLAKARGESK